MRGQLDACQAGTPLNEDDGVSCTIDSCDPVTGVANVATDSLCDDSDVCTGTETCDAVLDCQAGTPLTRMTGTPARPTSTAAIRSAATRERADRQPESDDDGVSCTIDSCDPVTGVANVATDSLCDDSDVCTG